MLKTTRAWIAKLGVQTGFPPRGKFRSRRFVLTLFVRLPLIAGGGLLSRRAVAARRRQEQERHAEHTIAAVLDRMLPSDGLPGARQLGLGRRIAAMGDSELDRSLAKGVAWLDGRARTLQASSFLDLDHAQQELVLQAAPKSSAEGAHVIVYRLRKLAFTLYYTHPTIVAEFPYAGSPQPGGFPDFQDPPR
jgi:gluconate 2-dehydrogenase subunit 3-like protein